MNARAEKNKAMLVQMKDSWSWSWSSRVVSCRGLVVIIFIVVIVVAG